MPHTCRSLLPRAKPLQTMKALFPQADRDKLFERFLLILAFSGLFAVPTVADDAPLLQCRTAWLTGRYQECIELADKQISGGTIPLDEYFDFKAQSQAATGHYADACTTLKEAVRINPVHLGHRWLLMKLAPYAEPDWVATAQRRQFEAILSGRGRQFLQDVSSLVTLARFALEQRADPKQVQDVLLKKAREADPLSAEPWIVSGQLALEKRDFALAADSFRQARKLEPRHPEGLFGLALALSESDQQASRQLLEQTLTVNPRHSGALITQVEHLIQAEQYVAALERLDTVIAVNPVHPEALALQSAICQLRGEDDKAGELRTQALSSWSTNPRVDFLIGRTLSRKYWFEAGAEAQRRALEFQPNDLAALKQLAQDLLRLGQEEEGWQLADSVYQRDQYDVASYNLITLRDELEKFTTFQREGLTVRMEAHEAEIYGERVLTLLEEARTTLCRKYDIELDKMIFVEIFPKPADFAVRTFGLPGAGGYLGVCFGDVVTARSPATENASPINWESVLWHEFTHVITLNKTRNRMPRWLSEGISVYEERLRNPLWGERMTPAYREMIQKGELTPISKLSGAFLAPKSPQHLMFAYFESSLVVEYLVKQYGLDALLAILDDLAAGMEINESIPRHTAPLGQLEVEFANHVRLQRILYGWSIDWSPVDLTPLLKEPEPMEKLLEWVRLNPRHYVGLKTCGELLVRLEHPREAVSVLQQAVELFPEETGPHSALGQLAALQKQIGDIAGEYQALEQQIRIDDKAAAALLRMIELDTADQQWEAVRSNALRLIAVRPLIPQPYTALARAGEHLHRSEEAISALETLLKLGPTDAADLHFRLAQQYQQQTRQNPDGLDLARRHLLQSLERAPRNRQALQLLLQLQQESSPAPE